MKFVKTKSLNNMTHTLRNPPRHVRDKDKDGEWGGGKELQRIIKVCSLQRTTRIHTMVTTTVFRGRNPVNKTRLNRNPGVSAKQCIPPCYHGTASLKARLHWLIA
jgi:hypothetical protein